MTAGLQLPLPLPNRVRQAGTLLATARAVGRDPLAHDDVSRLVLETIDPRLDGIVDGDCEIIGRAGSSARTGQSDDRTYQCDAAKGDRERRTI